MMLRATVLAALLLFVAASAPARDYAGWTISSSAIDPSATTAVVPGLQEFPLYLWLVCSIASDGWTTAELSIDNQATNFVMMSYTPMSGVHNFGTFPDNMLLAVGACPTGPTLVGRINSFALGPASGDVCIAPSSGGNRVTYDCAIPPVAHPIQARGFGFGAPASCDDRPGQPVCDLIENPPGACCMPGGICEINTLAGCEAAGGLFQGYYRSCSTAGCELIPTDTPIWGGRTWGRTKADYR